MTLIYYIIPVVIVIWGGYAIYTVYRRSQVNGNEKSAVNLTKEPALLKTQDIDFDIKSYPVLPGNIFLKNTSPAYYMDKQQLVLTQKGFILSAVVSGIEYAQRSFCFNINDLDSDTIKFSEVEYLIDSWSEDGDKISIKTKEQKYLFLPKYVVVVFKKYPRELADLIKEKVRKNYK